MSAAFGDRLAVGCAAVALLALAGAHKSLPSAPLPERLTFEQAAAGLGERGSQRFSTEGGDRVAEYGFRNYNGDDLLAKVRVPLSAVEESVAEYGVPDKELQQVHQWYSDAVKAANAAATSREHTNVDAANGGESSAVDRANARDKEAAARFNARDQVLVAEANAREKEAFSRAKAQENTGQITARNQDGLNETLHAAEAQNKRAAVEREGSRQKSKALLEQGRKENREQLVQARAEIQQQLAQERKGGGAPLTSLRAENHARLLKEVDDLTAERERRKAALYVQAGLRLTGNTISADVTKMVARNAPRLQRASKVLHDLARSHDYNLEDAVGAALAMVQTAVAYRVPPKLVAGKDLLGVLPPPMTLSEGWGDCDTKTALLASLLSGWQSVKMVGVSIPGHYLMGVQRIPGPRDAYVEVKGLPYVLLEPAGPGALPPGRGGEHTLSYLKAGGAYTVEPL